MKYLYCCYGEAGLKCLDLLVHRAQSHHNILVFTHETHENKKLINCLKSQSFKFSFDKLKSTESENKVKEFQPDYIVSIHYRDLIPEKILSYANFRGMNLHPSLLPKYAGCLATMWAIIKEESKTGITYHYLTKKFDDGRIILQKELKINANETGESLFKKTIDYGVSYFNEAMDLLESGYEGIEQKGKRTYFSRKIPFDGYINTEWNESRIDHFIRSFIFKGKPPASLIFNNKKYEIKSIKEYKEIVGGK